MSPPEERFTIAKVMVENSEADIARDHPEKVGPSEERPRHCWKPCARRKLRGKNFGQAQTFDRVKEPETRLASPLAV